MLSAIALMLTFMISEFKKREVKKYCSPPSYPDTSKDDSTGLFSKWTISLTNYIGISDVRLYIGYQYLSGKICFILLIIFIYF